MGAPEAGSQVWLQSHPPGAAWPAALPPTPSLWDPCPPRLGPGHLPAPRLPNLTQGRRDSHSGCLAAGWILCGPHCPGGQGPSLPGGFLTPTPGWLTRPGSACECPSFGGTVTVVSSVPHTSPVLVPGGSLWGRSGGAYPGSSLPPLPQPRASGWAWPSSLTLRCYSPARTVHRLIQMARPAAARGPGTCLGSCC